MSQAGVLSPLGLPGWVLDASLVPGDDLHLPPFPFLGWLPTQ